MADGKNRKQEEYGIMPLLTREELEEATAVKKRTPEEIAERLERRKRWAAELEAWKKKREMSGDK